jgi:hypothetical protein
MHCVQEQPKAVPHCRNKRACELGIPNSYYDSLPEPPPEDDPFDPSPANKDESVHNLIEYDSEQPAWAIDGKYGSTIKNTDISAEDIAGIMSKEWMSRQNKNKNGIPFTEDPTARAKRPIAYNKKYCNPGMVLAEKVEEIETGTPQSQPDSMFFFD